LRYFRWLIRLNGNKAIEAFKTDGFESLCFFLQQLFRVNFSTGDVFLPNFLPIQAGVIFQHHTLI